MWRVKYYITYSLIPVFSVKFFFTFPRYSLLVKKALLWAT
nr:MAG TPA: hypothetical protein [Bacteriophage sp.]